MSLSELNYPETFKLKITEQILGMVQKGASGFLRGLPHDGRSTYVKFFTRNVKVRERWHDFFAKTYVGYVYLPPANLLHVEDVLPLCLYGLGHVSPTRTSWLDSLQQVDRLLESHERILLIIDGIHALLPSEFIHALARMRTLYKGRLCYLFIGDFDFNLSQLGQMASAACEGEILYGLYSQADWDASFGVRDAKLLENISASSEEIIRLTGGHAGLAKLVLNSWKQTNGEVDKVLKQPGVLAMCEDIWLSLGKKVQFELLQFVLYRMEVTQNSWLATLGIVKQGKVFSSIFEAYIFEMIEGAARDGLSLKVHEFDITEHLSEGERKVLVLLFDHMGKDVSRDQIGEAWWGRGFNEKYSDWAVDKMISGLRKKVERWPMKIETVTKVGYRLVKKNY